MKKVFTVFLGIVVIIIVTTIAVPLRAEEPERYDQTILQFGGDEEVVLSFESKPQNRIQVENTAEERSTSSTQLRFIQTPGDQKFPIVGEQGTQTIQILPSQGGYIVVRWNRWACLNGPLLGMVRYPDGTTQFSLENSTKENFLYRSSAEWRLLQAQKIGAERLPALGIVGTLEVTTYSGEPCVVLSWDWRHIILLPMTIR